MSITRFTRGAAVLAVSALGFCASTASAQVLYGNEGTDDAIYLLNLSTNTSSVFFSTTGFGTTGVYGLATNFDDGVIYWSDNNEIHTVTFGGVHTGSSVVVSGAVTSLFGGLAYDDANNILYGTNNTNNLYTIALATGIATDLGDVTGAGTLSGLAWDNGTLYGSDDGANDAFVRIDVGVSPPVAIVIPGSNFPGGDSDMDGMAAGGGSLFGVNDLNIGSSGTNPGGIFDFNLATSTYGPTRPTAYIDEAIFSGGTFIPEPSALGLLALAGLNVSRRRRRA